MKSIWYTITSLVLLVFGVLLVYEGWHIVSRFFNIISRYQWIGVGIVGFAVFHHFVSKNRDFMETFSHELTHGVVALLCFREITSFQANKHDGVIWTRGWRWSQTFVSLAPYCLPIFTYMILLIWSLVATRSLVATGALFALDIIVGMTIAFHFFCFKSQTGSYQADINQFPLWFSYIYIWFFRLFNALVILLCYMPSFKTGHPLKLWGAVWYLIEHIWNDILAIF